MTSRNSSSASFISGQRELLRRRMWPFALCLLLFALQHVAGTFLVLSSTRTTMENSGLYSAAEIARELQAGASLLLGLRSLSSVITVVLAIVLAIQGQFPWLLSATMRSPLRSPHKSREARVSYQRSSCEPVVP